MGLGLCPWEKDLKQWRVWITRAGTGRALCKGLVGHAGGLAFPSTVKTTKAEASPRQHHEKVESLHGAGVPLEESSNLHVRGYDFSVQAASMPVQGSLL